MVQYVEGLAAERQRLLFELAKRQVEFLLHAGVPEPLSRSKELSCGPMVPNGVPNAGISHWKPLWLVGMHGPGPKAHWARS